MNSFKEINPFPSFSTSLFKYILMNFSDSLLASTVNSILCSRMESPGPGEEEVEGGEACSSEFVLESPATVREFEQKKGQLWAKQIVIDYWRRTDEGWLLAPLLKILSVIAKENPTPGGLSRSYHLEVK